MIESEEELFREFLGLAEGLAGRFCKRWGDLVDREDIYQEARMELVRAVRALTCRASAGPYIQRRVNGAMLRWLRDRSRLVRVPRTEQEGKWVDVHHVSLDKPLPHDPSQTALDYLPAPCPEPEDDTMTAQVEAMLDQIPAIEAAAIRLCILQGQSATAAAEDLGITRRKTVVERKLRGLRRLRDALAEG